MNIYIGMSWRMAGCLLVSWVGAGLPAWSQTPVPIVNFTFNNPQQSSEINAGDDARQTILDFKDATGKSVNLHSAAGLGLTGQPTDAAFDNTASAIMGVPGPGGVAVSEGAPRALDNLASFTITGWFRTPKDGIFSNGARLFDTFGSGGTNVTVMAGNPAGTLNLGVNGASVTTTGGYGAQGVWVFFAVTYDSSKSVDNVTFYVGNGTDPVTVVGADTLTKQPAASFYTLCIGNRFTRDRPFKGMMDDLKIFGTSTDTSGALSLAQIQSVYEADKAGK